MSVQKFIILVIISGILAINCNDSGTNEEPEHEEIISSNRVQDVDNTTSASDIYLELDFPLYRDVTEIRIMLVPFSIDESFDVNTALTLDSESYMSISASNVRFRGNLAPDLKDVEGNDIQLNVPYVIRYLLISDSDSWISSKSVSVTLTNVHPLVGKYTGLWNDNFYTNFGVSMIISEHSDGILLGEFFYTSNFTPCCNAAQQGATNDGTVRIEIDEETRSIPQFIYNQVLLTYMGGCNGSYTGKGNYNNRSMTVSFEGSDCDGYHENGSISLNRGF